MEFNKCCLSPDTIIYGIFGVKKIVDINIGDMVLTLDGTYKEVIEIYQNDIKEEIFKIYTSYSFEEILIKKNYQIYVYDEEDSIPCCVKIDDLNSSHKICFPLDKNFTVDNVEMVEYYKFYGILYAKGYIYEEENSILIIFEEYKNIISFLEDFLIKERIFYVKNGFTFNIKLDDIKKEKFKNIYNEKKLKYINNEFFNISKNDIKEFLNGVFDSCDKFFITDNKILAYQLSFLSIKSCKPRECIKDDCLYKISCKSNDDLYDIYEYDDDDDDDVELNSLFESKIWFNIKDIDRVYYEGTVYGLEIDMNNNYTTNLGLV
jgi:hypothetical protein